MHWFVVGIMITILWGNGAVETTRTDWKLIYLGTPSGCAEAAAGSLAETRRYFRTDSVYLSGTTIKHGKFPERFSGGVRALVGSSAFCAPFDSQEDIKLTLGQWRGLSGVREQAGGTVQFKWWLGAAGDSVP